MSDDAPPTGAPPSPRRRLSELVGTLSDLAAGLHAPPAAAAANADAAAAPAPPSDGPDATEVRRRVRESQTKLAAMLDGLIRNLDIAAYCEMSVLYYMDNSLALLLLRLVPHWLFYTPKPSFFPPPPTHRPYVLGAVVTTSAAALAHAALDAPSAGEATRGYLHGGFLIDFVGEAGPVAKGRLLLADLAVFVLQMVLLAVVLEREELRGKMGGRAAGAAEAEARPVAEAGQDHDAEEQGILRAEAEAGRRDEGEDQRVGRREKHHLDDLHSGQYVVANLFVFDAIRRSWWWNYDR